MARSILDDRSFGERVVDVFKMPLLLLGFLLFMISLVAVAAFFGAWGEMLFVGILHGEYWHHIPTMSFATAFKLNLVVIIFMLIVKFVAEGMAAWFKNAIN